VRRAQRYHGGIPLDNAALLEIAGFRLRSAVSRYDYRRDPALGGTTVQDDCAENQQGRAEMRNIVTALTLAALGAFGAVAAQSATLDDVKQRGKLICGVAPNIPGYAFTDDKGVVRGFDVEFCHALAAAVLGDPAKIETKPLQPRDAFAQLQNGGVDILTHRFTWTYTRDNGAGMSFVMVYLYDGQGFMVKQASGVKSATELNGASICIGQGTTTELNIGDYFRAHNMKYQIVSFAELDEARRAYEAGRCDAWSNDRGSLAARGLQLTKRADHVILPETISKEPIGPVVRKSDPQWLDIARWTFYSLIDAEELGITQANVDEVKKASENPEVKRLLGVTDEFGSKNGLSNDWAFDAIKAVGNYGEIFDRYIGPKTPLGLDRGLNRLWKDGGLLYTPPFR
jgi:general L-amino acid transport system substrate-binding protein